MEPITEADRPRSWPSTGTTKVCTSQHEDSNQLTSSSRRNIGSRTRSQAVPPRCLSDATTGGSSCTRSHPEPATAAAARPSAGRPSGSPPWSISRPALNGPRKLETAGPIASQENTCLSCVGFSAARPDVALQRDRRRAGGAAGQQRAQAQHREHRKGDGQARTQRGRDHAQAHRPLAGRAGRHSARPAAPGTPASARTAPAARRPQPRCSPRAAPAAARPCACRPCRHAGRPGRRSGARARDSRPPLM